MFEEKSISRTKSAIRKEIINEDTRCNCLLCGEKLKSVNRGFHKSHTIPLFCLNNIKGHYAGVESVVLNPVVCGFHTPFSEDDYVSVKKAGVFYSICSECDNSIFKQYESEKALLEKDPLDLLDAIALKTYINEMYISYIRNLKSLFEYSKLTEDEIIARFYNQISVVDRKVSELDLIDFADDYRFAKRSYDKHYCNYNLLFYKILDYTVPIAAQTTIPISRNVDNTELQKVTNYSLKRIDSLILAIFPLKEKTVVMLFSRTDNFALRKYKTQFNMLSENEKLREILYLLIRYKSATYFFSPYAIDVLANSDLRNIFTIEDTVIINKENGIRVSIADFEDHKWKENMPLLLSEQYSIQQLTR